MSGNVTFHLRDYVLKEPIGGGAYGLVALGVSKKTGREVAIKRVTPFGKALICLRTLREIQFLRQLDHPNIVKILEVQKPSSLDTFHEVYIIQEYMDADLHTVIQTCNLEPTHVQFFLYQILKAVKYLHSCGIIHRDLKPSNVLVSEDCHLKICDFGLSRLEKHTDSFYDVKSDLTEYVATRWYRAPEIMLSAAHYTNAIDIWSVGCIAAEIILRTPLFPGKNWQNQLERIFEILGPPSNEDMQTVTSKQAREFVYRTMQRKRTRKIPMRQLFPNVDPDLGHFVMKTLTFNPAKRINVLEALDEPYFESCRVPESEIVSPPLPADFCSFDEYKNELSMGQLKRMLYEEALKR